MNSMPKIIFFKKLNVLKPRYKSFKTTEKFFRKMDSQV